MLDLSPGSVFADQFEVVRPLAKGGMGAVYVVKQLGTGRERALKLMHPMLVSDERSLERFEREAKVGSEIESDHVVEVIAAGVDRKSSTPWLCMELLKGETLAERVERSGPLGREEAIDALEQLGHALAAAHRAGIVHRDLKPENLFLAAPRRQGVAFTLKVLDFGVAAMVKEAASAKTTQGVGSPMWMAPEQTDLGKVTRATDVWALGLIAYYVLTGTLYWKSATKQGASLTALLVEIMVEPLEPASARASALGRALPAGFDAWFARCVARDPAQRFQDVEAAVRELVALVRAGGELRASGPVRLAVPQAFEETAAASTGPVPGQGAPRAVATAPAKRRIWPWVLGGGAGLLAIGCGLVSWGILSGARAIEEATDGPVLRIEDHDGTVELGPEGMRVVLRDGGTIAVGAMRPIEAETASETETGTDTEAVAADTVPPVPAAVPAPDPDPVPEPVPAARPHRASSSPATAAVMPLLRHCWDETAGAAGAPRTRVRLTLMVDPAGHARNVRFEGDRDAIPLAFRRCVVTNLSGVHVEPPPGTPEVPVTATLGG